MTDIRHVDLSISEYPVCDFCSSPNPLWLESCEDFDVYTAIMTDNTAEIGTSKGDWAACQVCHYLVRDQKWHTLERRAIDAIAARHPEFSRSKVREGVQTMHGRFREHRRPE